MADEDFSFGGLLRLSVAGQRGYRAREDSYSVRKWPDRLDCQMRWYFSKQSSDTPIDTAIGKAAGRATGRSGHALGDMLAGSVRYRQINNQPDDGSCSLALQTLIRSEPGA